MSAPSKIDPLPGLILLGSVPAVGFFAVLGLGAFLQSASRPDQLAWLVLFVAFCAALHVPVSASLARISRPGSVRSAVARDWSLALYALVGAVLIATPIWMPSMGRLQVVGILIAMTVAGAATAEAAALLFVSHRRVGVSTADEP